MEWWNAGTNYAGHGTELAQGDAGAWQVLGEAVVTTVFILNRSPTWSVEGMTPFEAWYGSKPPVHFFYVFGYVAHVKFTGGHRSKLDDRSTPMVFIGYEPGSKAYRFYNPNTDRIHISRDAMFNEGRSWN
jgi:hypothetical protein